MERTGYSHGFIGLLGKWNYGTFIVVRRMALMGDAISHGILLD